MMFYPENSVVPIELSTQDFLLRPLRATDVKLDYVAVMESKDFLRLWSQSEWPTDNFTLADNLKDLEEHEQEHLDREAFTFTVMNPAETECLGCVYINPFELSPEERIVDDADFAIKLDDAAVIAFWIRQSRLGEALDERLLDTLITWFKDEWAFTRLLFVTNEQVSRQISLLDKSELQQRFVVEIPEQAGKDVFYAYM